ncbi:MAG: L,D-transpeptidase family protein [Magnetospirillum sp.]|nr:L,D-transpeptidase family protein [Magnetospirillum sp.]
MASRRPQLPWNSTLDILVSKDGMLDWDGVRVRCALGRSGIALDKREGDGATPIGCWALKQVMYRPDRVAAPATALPVSPLAADDGWCDDPGHGDYNCPVRLPHPASCEKMWREDELYDVVVVLGHNDDPPVPGLGSAIFLHVAKPGWQPTEGCVALALPDLLALLAAAVPGDRICVSGG